MRVVKAATAGLLALLLCYASAAFADVAVPQLTGRVVDRTATLSSDQIASLDTTLTAFEARKGSQVAVLIVPTTAPETIEQFAIRVAEAWKIGRKRVDDGAILVVAKDDRSLRIEVGYGLEGALTDVTAKRIIDDVIVPKFRSGDFAGGISDGVDRMLKVIDGEPLPAPKPERTDAFGDIGSSLPVLAFGVLIVGGVLRSLFGRLFGALATGGLAAIVMYVIAGALSLAGLAGLVAFVVTLVSDAIGSPMSGGRGGGWSGGSGGGFSGGSGGGFSGGGGGFGGGGASGEMVKQMAGLGIARITRHLVANRARVRRAFPAASLARIEAAIAASEATHGGQIRVVIEGALDGEPLFRQQTAQARALDVFALQRVWDTEHNNGVLIYLLLADRDVEIVADRGIHGHVGGEGWERICRAMEQAFMRADYEAGVLAGIAAVTQHLATHFPKTKTGGNELPDDVVVI